MSSTLAGIYYENNRMNIFNVGDSRVYRISSGVLSRLTEDDAVAYKLYRDGVISEREIETHPQKNVLTNYFGNNPIDFFVHYKEDYDFDGQNAYLVMSDGISDFVSDKRIEELAKMDIDGLDKIRLLIGEAMKNGSNDDISIVLVEIQND